MGAETTTTTKGGLTGIKHTIAVNVGLVLAQIAFGGYHVIGKDALKHIGPVVFAFYREIIAGPTLIIIALIFERVKPNIKEDWWRFLLLGITGVYLNQLLFVEGLNYTSATQAAIMQPCIPVFTTAFTLVLRMEKFSVLKVIGILFSAGGAVVMVGVNNISFKSEQFIGMMCLVGNTLAVSVYYILQKPVLKKYPPISVTGWAYMIGSVLMGITSVIATKGEASKYKVVDAVYLPLAYSIFIATVFTYMTLTWANKHAPASVVAAYCSLQPLAAAVLSYIAWHSVPTRDEYIGGAAIIVGLAIVTFARTREKKEELAAGSYHPINTNLPYTNPSLYGNDYVNTTTFPPKSETSKWRASSEDKDIQHKSFQSTSDMASTPPVSR